MQRRKILKRFSPGDLVCNNDSTDRLVGRVINYDDKKKFHVAGISRWCTYKDVDDSRWTLLTADLLEEIQRGWIAETNQKIEIVKGLLSS